MSAPKENSWLFEPYQGYANPLTFTVANMLANSAADFKWVQARAARHKDTASLAQDLKDRFQGGRVRPLRGGFQRRVREFWDAPTQCNYTAAGGWLNHINWLDVADRWSEYLAPQ